jgi:hypothetical protein
MPSWLPSILFTAINSFIGLVLAFAYLRYKVDDLSKNETVSKMAQERANAKLEQTIKETIQEFHDSIQEDRKTLVEIAMLAKVSGAEQAVINKFTTGLLNSLADKVERLEKNYTEMSQIVMLIKELLLKKERE